MTKQEKATNLLHKIRYELHVVKKSIYFGYDDDTDDDDLKDYWLKCDVERMNILKGRERKLMIFEKLTK